MFADLSAAIDCPAELGARDCDAGNAHFRAAAGLLSVRQVNAGLKSLPGKARARFVSIRRSEGHMAFMCSQKQVVATNASMPNCNNPTRYCKIVGTSTR